MTDLESITTQIAAAQIAGNSRSGSTADAVRVAKQIQDLCAREVENKPPSAATMEDAIATINELELKVLDGKLAIFLLDEGRKHSKEDRMLDYNQWNEAKEALLQKCDGWLHPYQRTKSLERALALLEKREI